MKKTQRPEALISCGDGMEDPIEPIYQKAVDIVGIIIQTIFSVCTCQHCQVLLPVGQRLKFLFGIQSPSLLRISKTKRHV